MVGAVLPTLAAIIRMSCGLIKELLGLPARTMGHEADIPLGCSSDNPASRGSD